MAYDIASAFEDIELSLIKSMRNNMRHHISEEYEEGINWTQWQAEMLSGLSQYRAQNKDVLTGYMGRLNDEIDKAIREAYATGESEQEIELLKAIKKGYEAPKDGTNMQGRFFRSNQRKLNSLIKATTKDMKKAETALLRMSDDVYRQTLHKAQLFYNTGAGSMWQCIDMATRDFLNAGYNCVQYKNGARVNIASYAEMALRTANKRANLMGQADFRERYGVHTVKVNARGTACPRCLPFLGQVFIDDVYGGGTYEESTQTGYPLLSSAVNSGLFHPNCKDACSSYYEGISREPKTVSKDQEEETLRRYNLEQEQRYYERNYRRNMRLAKGSMDSDTADKYYGKANICKNKLIELCDNNSDVLRLDKARISLRGVLSVDNVGRLSIKPDASKIRTIEEINTDGRKIVWNNWDEYRQKYFKNAVPIYEVDLDNPNRTYDTFDISILKDVNTQNKIVDTVQGLGQKYYSPLTTVRTMKKEDALGNSAFAATWHQWGLGTANIELNPLKLNEKGIKRIYELSEIGYSVKIPKGKEIEYVITHEYGHSILNIGETLPSKSRNFVQADFTDIKKARKEITEIFDRYVADVSVLQKEYDSISRRLDSKFLFEGIAPTDEERAMLEKSKEKLEVVKISKYSLTNIDEFTAEAFADVEIGEKPSEYSEEVHAVITKYFGKGDK